MKKILLVAACCFMPAILAGCATVKVEVDDAREGYAIYSNGKKVCNDSKNCHVPVAGGDEMYLEAEKNGVVYGEAVIHRGDGGYRTRLMLPLEYITTTTEYFPTEVMIPVMPPESGEKFPWDQPDPSK